MLRAIGLKLFNQCKTINLRQCVNNFNYANLIRKSITLTERKQFFSTTNCIFAAHQPFTLKTIEDRIKLTLSLYDKINPEILTMDSDFFNDLGLDSLDFVEVIIAIEDEFQFEIPDGDSDRFKTPRDIFQYICDKCDVYE